MRSALVRAQLHFSCVYRLSLKGEDIPAMLCSSSEDDSEPSTHLRDNGLSLGQSLVEEGIVSIDRGICEEVSDFKVSSGQLKFVQIF